MTTRSKHYDAIIIGTGQGGVPLAQALAGAGWKTAILEKKWVGGTCINVGCTPTKTMVASARVAYLARRAADYGVHTGRRARRSAPRARRKRDIVHSFRGGSQSGLESTKNLDLIFGTAAFVGRKALSLRPHGGGATRTLSADVIVINTGCRPRPATIRASTRCARSTPPPSWSWSACRGTSPCSAAATSGSSSGRCSAASAARSP
jgi:pyruvate/2-oxoglutarate dehydrogenase complex dihydrolipoamide dehydrogenase (E3) component